MTNNISIEFDSLIKKFETMSDEIDEIGKKALNVGAYELKTKVKSAFASKMPTATKPVRQQSIKGYAVSSGEPLIDAVRQTKVSNGHTKVHILGAGQPHSSLFIARFYENDTKTRYQKSFKGKKLKKPRKLGKLEGKHFFMPTVDEQVQSTMDIIYDVIENKTEQILNNNG